MTVNPQNGTKPYNVPITSGKGSCMNNPACSKRRNKGPVPSGKYNIKTDDLTNPGILGDIARNTRGDWGDWRAPLSPTGDTDTFGRDGFFMHGGMQKGSAGCVDVGGGIFGDDMTDRLLKDLLADPDGVVPIVIY